MKKKEYTDNEKLMIKEVKKCINLKYLEDRLNYIDCALLYCVKFGLRRYRQRYPNLKNFKLKELRFYSDILSERITTLKKYRELETQRYRKENLI